jgi:hypothetical protein
VKVLLVIVTLVLWFLAAALIAVTLEAMNLRRRWRDALDVHESQVERKLRMLDVSVKRHEQQIRAAQAWREMGTRRNGAK